MRMTAEAPLNGASQSNTKTSARSRADVSFKSRTAREAPEKDVSHFSPVLAALGISRMRKIEIETLASSLVARRGSRQSRRVTSHG
jgi:hypothetical protein